MAGRVRLSVGIGAVAVAVSACGPVTAQRGVSAGGAAAVTSPAAVTTPTATTTPQPAASPMPTATPAPPPPPRQVATFSWDVVTQPSRLHLYSSSGASLTSVALPPITDATVHTTAGGGGAYYLGGNGHLMRLGPDATINDLGVLSGIDSRTVGDASLAVSPDGTRWVWAAVEVQTEPVATLTSHLWVGGAGLAPELVASHTSPAGSTATEIPWYYRVYRWTPGGVIVVRSPSGVGGCCFLNDHYNWGAYRLDPVTRALTDLGYAGGIVDDLLPDGSAVVVAGMTGPAAASGSIRVVAPDGTVRTSAPLPAGLTQAGQAIASPDGTTIAFAGSAGPQSPAAFHQYLLTPATGQVREIGPVGFAAGEWLDGSTLVGNADPSWGFGGRQTQPMLLTTAGAATPFGTGMVVGVTN